MSSMCMYGTEGGARAKGVHRGRATKGAVRVDICAVGGALGFRARSAGTANRCACSVRRREATASVLSNEETGRKGDGPA